MNQPEIQPQPSVQHTPPPPAPAPVPSPETPTLSMPTVDELIKTPVLPSDTFQFLPGPCIHSAVQLLISTIRAAAAAASPGETHQAFLRFHMIPTVVFRKSLRGEPGWRSSLGQMHALHRRIRRAKAGEWASLWHEALAAHEARQQWYQQHFPQPRNRRTRRIARALKLASQAQYTRAMRTLTNDPIADLNEPSTHSALADLHPTPSSPVNPLNPTDLPLPPEIDEAQVLRAVKRMNPNSAPGPDRMSPRLLHLLATSEVSPEAGVTGLSALTRLVKRLARADIPEQTLPLVAAATLIPICPRPDKIRPIAIGQAIRRLATKVLLPAAISDSRDYLAPEQMANGIPSAMDAIVHDARMLMRRHGTDPNYAMVAIDANNAFNSCSRQSMLNALPTRSPSLARFINAMYAKTLAHLVIPSSPPRLISSREGTQQGDPASMLLFSLAIQPLIREISEKCNLCLNRWYADDGLLIGTIPEIRKALKILREKGPEYQFSINVGKTKAFWPTTDPVRQAHLTEDMPIQIASNGLTILGAPVGTSTFMSASLQSKLDQCNLALDQIKDVPDARIKFHLHRMTGSACRVQHIFRLVPPDFSLPFASQFDKDQMKAYSRFNNVPLSPSVIDQIRLPIRLGGHGFPPMAPLVHASYAASLIEAAPIRVPHPHAPSVDRYLRMARPAMRAFVRNLPTNMQPHGFTYMSQSNYQLGDWEPQILAERPERTHTVLFQAHSETSSNTFWQSDLWRHSPTPGDHSTATVRRRVRYNALLNTNAASFLCAHPSTSSKVFSDHWSVMLRRHLDVPVYEDSQAPLKCSHCTKPMDFNGDHATKCRTGFGVIHRHNNLRNSIARNVIKRAGLAYSLEVPFLIPDTSRRPADILAQPGPRPPGALLEHPTAYDITIRSPFTSSALKHAATKQAGAAELAQEDKNKSLQKTLRDAFHLNDAEPIPQLDWSFYPLAFDTYGAPATAAGRFIEQHARKIAFRSGTSYSSSKQRIEQCISYSIWSSIAESILSRMPSSVAASTHNTHQ